MILTETGLENHPVIDESVDMVFPYSDLMV